VEKDANGEEVFVIPVKAPTPSRFEDLKNPGPAAGSLYTDAEMARIERLGLKWAAQFLDGWTLANCDLGPSWMLWESQGRKNVFVLNGLAKGAKGYSLTKTVTVPAGKAASLAFAAACDPRTDGWRISVKADGKELAGQAVNQETMKGGWAEISAALPDAAGKPAVMEVTAEPVTPPAGRKGPPALSIAVPQVAVR
jgi:hypothetical protein